MNDKEIEDIDLVNSLVKLNIQYAIKDSNINLEMIENRIKFYQRVIENLEDNKPLFFQKKKIIEYNKKLEEYNNKLNDLYNQFDKEICLIEKLYQKI